MLRKLIVFAITSGLAARLYRNYVSKNGRVDVAANAPATTRRRRAGAPVNQG
jgi:Tfp pilus assembly major pilin PilA